MPRPSSWAGDLHQIPEIDRVSALLDVVAEGDADRRAALYLQRATLRRADGDLSRALNDMEQATLLLDKLQSKELAQQILEFRELVMTEWSSGSSPQPTKKKNTRPPAPVAPSHPSPSPPPLPEVTKESSPPEPAPPPVMEPVAPVDQDHEPVLQGSPEVKPADMPNPPVASPELPSTSPPNSANEASVQEYDQKPQPSRWRWLRWKGWPGSAKTKDAGAANPEAKRERLNTFRLGIAHDSNVVLQEVNPSNPLQQQDQSLEAGLALRKKWALRLGNHENESAYRLAATLYRDLNSLNSDTHTLEHNIGLKRKQGENLLLIQHRFALLETNLDRRALLWAGEYSPSFMWFQKSRMIVWGILPSVRSTTYIQKAQDDQDGTTFLISLLAVPLLGQEHKNRLILRGAYLKEALDSDVLSYAEPVAALAYEHHLELGWLDGCKAEVASSVFG